MKNLISTLIIILFLIGCATMPVQNSVCPQEGSWICEKSTELGVQPEQVYGWIYDAAALAMISDVIEIQDLCNFEQEIADWYSSVYPVSYSRLIVEMIDLAVSYDTKKIMLIGSILNRHLLAYDNPALISTADDIILRKGHVAFRQDLLCY